MICIYIINWLLITFFYWAFSVLRGYSTPQNDISKKKIHVHVLHVCLISTHGVFLYVVVLSLSCNVDSLVLDRVAALTWMTPYPLRERQNK